MMAALNTNPGWRATRFPFAPTVYLANVIRLAIGPAENKEDLARRSNS
jgi:hypothetical protein